MVVWGRTVVFEKFAKFAFDLDSVPCPFSKELEKRKKIRLGI